MSRLCERPGCSEPGAAAYGMIPEDLLFWIAPLATSPTPDDNVLCRRHSDAMVVPRGWTLDDRRDQTPRLFKPRSPSLPGQHRPTARRSAKKAPAEAPVGEQLVLDGTGDIPRPPADQIAAVEVSERDQHAMRDRSADTEQDADVDDPAVLAWSPAFDHDDDLDGLLEVKSPLLARAFRGTGRPRH